MSDESVLSEELQQQLAAFRQAVKADIREAIKDLTLDELVDWQKEISEEIYDRQKTHL